MRSGYGGEQRAYTEDACSAKTATSPSETNGELNAIENLIETLQKQTQVLSERLDYVSRPDAPVGQGIAGPAPTPSVPLAARLASIRGRLSGVSGHLDNITSRIDP